MKKHLLVVCILFSVSVSSFGCINIYTQKPGENIPDQVTSELESTIYPDEPLLILAADINANPVNYDQLFLAVKGTVTAVGTQPSLQIGWYDLADETGVITVLTTQSEVPDVGEKYWISGTVMNMTKIIGQRSISIFLQEKRKINLQK